MKKVPVMMLAVMCFSTAFTQKKLLSYEYGFSSRDYITTTTIQSKKNNGFLLSVRNRNSIQRILVNETGRSVSLLEQFFTKDTFSVFKYHSNVSGSIESLYKKCNFIGGAFDNGKITEILRGKLSRSFYFLETDLRTGISVLTDTLDTKDDEKIIACHNYENKTYLLTYIVNSNKLIIHDKEISKKVLRTQLDINLPNLGKIRNTSLSENINEFSEIFKKNNFAVYENNMRYPVLLTAIRNKAYVQQQKIVFTVSSNKLNTYVITVDMNNHTYSINTFDQDEIEKDNSGKATTASCLIDSLLITCHAKDRILKLNLFNTSSGKKLKSFEITNENVSALASNEIQKTGGFLSKSDVKNTDFDKFYKTAKANELSMSGYIENGKLYLSFAAPYKQFITGTTLLNVAMTAAGTYFINAAPNSYGYFIYGMSGVQNPTFIGFETTIDLQSTNFVKNTADFTAWDRILSFLETRKLELKHCQFFYMNEHYYIGYPLFDENRVYVYRFNEKQTDN